MTSTHRSAESHEATRPAANTDTSPAALFTFEDTSRYIKLGRSHIYGRMAEGDFPLPIKIGRSSRWLKSEIDDWIAKRVAARQYELDQVGA